MTNQGGADRVSRMPSIEFSDDTDYDGLFTLLSKMNFVFDFVLADGTVHSGVFISNYGDVMTVYLYEGGQPSGEYVRFHADQLVKAVYL